MTEISLRDHILQQPPDLKTLPCFEYNGNALLVPTVNWLREAEWYITPEHVEETYNRFLAPQMGDLSSLTDDVFIISEYDVEEEMLKTGPTGDDDRFIPRLSKGIGNPDILCLQRVLILGFAANFLASHDNRDRRLPMPGWHRDRNFTHLKNVNHALNDFLYIRSMARGNGSFSLLIPEEFQRVISRKAEIQFPEFSGSRSVQLLFPDIDKVPYDEVSDIAKGPECKELKTTFRAWDDQLQNDPQLDWGKLGRAIQPILDALFSELEKQRVSKTRAWISMLASLLPAPLGATPSAIDLVNAHRATGLAPALTRITRARRKGSGRKLH